MIDEVEVLAVQVSAAKLLRSLQAPKFSSPLLALEESAPGLLERRLGRREALGLEGRKRGDRARHGVRVNQAAVGEDRAL